MRSKSFDREVSSEMGLYNYLVDLWILFQKQEQPSQVLVCLEIHSRLSNDLACLTKDEQE